MDCQNFAASWENNSWLIGLLHYNARKMITLLNEFVVKGNLGNQ